MEYESLTIIKRNFGQFFNQSAASRTLERPCSIIELQKLPSGKRNSWFESRGHDFAPVTLDVPTWCDMCSRLIYSSMDSPTQCKRKQ